MASCSDYFRAMFSHDMLESKSDQLELPAIQSSGFEPLLNYAYSGKLKLNLLNIGDVLATSSFLQVMFAIFRFEICVLFLPGCHLPGTYLRRIHSLSLIFIQESIPVVCVPPAC